MIKYGVDIGKTSRRSRWASTRTCTTSNKALVRRRGTDGDAEVNHGTDRIDFLGLQARERPRRRAQPRDHPAGRRPVERRRRGGREQHQGHAGDPASLRAPAVRRGPRPALPHADRHRAQPERRRRRRDRHRGRLGEEGGRRHRRHRQARRRLRHRAARRPRHDHARLEEGEGIRAVGERAAPRGARR